MNRRSVLRTLYTGGSLVLVAGSAGCSTLGALSGESENVEGTLIEMTDSNRFEPKTAEILAGETVIWRNIGYSPHTVTAYEDAIPAKAVYFASGGFTSEQAARNGASQGNGTLDGGDEYEHSFDVSGMYEYFCIPHESMRMTGTVVVKDPSTNPSAAVSTHRSSDTVNDIPERSE